MTAVGARSRVTFVGSQTSSWSHGGPKDWLDDSLSLRVPNCESDHAEAVHRDLPRRMGKGWRKVASESLSQVRPQKPARGGPQPLRLGAHPRARCSAASQIRHATCRGAGVAYG